MGRVKPLEVIELRHYGELTDPLDRERIKINALLYASFNRNCLSFVRYDLEHLNERDRRTLEKEYSALGAKLINPDAGCIPSNSADLLEFNFPTKE